MAFDAIYPEDWKEAQQALHTQSMELAYEKALRLNDRIYEEEKARRLRLNILLLEDENDDLNAQLMQDEERIEELETNAQEVQFQVSAAEREAERLKGDLRMKLREVGHLKAELNSLQGVSTDSTQLLTEKLALSRELAALKPEVEHLRSQVATNQTLLAEKLSLQRQLSTLQVELETEKRAARRLSVKSVGRIGQDDKSEAQIETLQAEVAKERKERQRAEREKQQLSSEFEGKKTVLESRLDAFRNKLRTTKEQFKEMQLELAQARETIKTQAAQRGTKNSTGTTVHARKRTIAQADDDTAIGTPGILPATKRAKRGPSAVPGEKSTFSITPFLNRTTSIAPESPVPMQASIEVDADALPAEEDDAIDELSPSTAKVTRKPTQKAAKSPVKNKPTALLESKADRTNASRPAPKRTKKAVTTLSRVAEEGNDENEEPAEPEVGAKPSKPNFEDLLLKPTGLAGRGMSEEPTFIKKKRKLLGGGRTLFDDDDGEAPKAAGKGAFSTVRGFGALGKTGLGLGAGKLGAKAGLAGAVGGGFGTFSPLKKDRKAAAMGGGA